jgi:hypothetical protein
VNGKIAAAYMLGGAATLTAAVAIGERQRQAGTARLIAELTVPAFTPDHPPAVSFGELGALPEPVGRYFRHVLGDGAPYVQSTRIEQAGEFNLNVAQERWHPFTAVQVYRTRRPGYVWDARIAQTPLPAIAVRDAYVGGRGATRATTAAFVVLADDRGRDALDEAALLRYLAEAVLFPTALLPSEGVRWSPVDADHATARLIDGRTTAELQYEFAPNGSIVAATARRARAERGGFISTPWAARVRDYEIHAGMRVPMAGEAAWVIDGQPAPYIRFRVTGVHFRFAPPLAPS